MAELVRVAREQGYLTRDDIHETFSDVWSKAGEEQECFKQLQLLDLQIVESLDLLPKAPLDADVDKHRDAVDDLLRCYLTEIGTVALLKPEQEQSIGKRMEEANQRVEQILARFGFGAKEHLAAADKLLCNPPKERFDRIVADQKVPNREAHLKQMRVLVKEVGELDAQADELYTKAQQSRSQAERGRHMARLARVLRAIRPKLASFFFEQKVIEEMASIAQNAARNWSAARPFIRSSLAVSAKE